ncbi:MAG: N-acetylmuramoyl-L-alanine amidase [Planctomycetia bacterium]|nr:N-acetylmuramoyl-L-alanine amidase [Planctomycetia bacterium]
MYKKILSILSHDVICIGNTTIHRHERTVRCLSLCMIVVASGLSISIPFFPRVKIDRAKSYTDLENSFYKQDIEQLCSTVVREKPWKYIVIHHSATAKGNAARFDHYHRKEKKWEYGLAYHFVIGNGSFSGDGEIEVGERWKKQIHGAHTANIDCNRVAIGICLVGDFEHDGAPTENQIDALVRLMQYLSRKYTIASSDILQHKQVHQKCTACPGKNFPFAEVKTRLLQIASKRNSHSREL